MGINEKTIAEIVKRGDVTTLFEIIRSLVRNINNRDHQLKLHAATMAKLRATYAKTESERDRLRRMVDELIPLCAEAGLADRTQEIVDRHGGLERPTEAITIELE